MTSKPIDIRFCLTLRAEGEAPEELTGTGERMERDGKTLFRLGDKRVQVEKERVLVRQGYTLDLDKNRETDLLYPTPYGTLSMKVKTKKLDVSPDGATVYAKYALLTAGNLIHYVEMTLKTERI